MSEKATSKDSIMSAPTEASSGLTDSMAQSEKVDAPVESTSVEEVASSKNVATAPTSEVASEKPTASSEAEPLAEKDPESTNNKPTTDQQPEDKPATSPDSKDDADMKEETKQDDSALAASSANDTVADAEASAKKTPSRRKSAGVPEHQKKTLKKKASKAKMTHTDAKPGDYFMIRLKGYPLWPGIVCDEDMLPTSLLKSRPVTAIRADGTYREDCADGGAKVKDRSFSVMYLHTNEFGWVINTDLVDMDVDTVGNVTSSMRKDLAQAHALAAEQHDLDYFKEILHNHMNARDAEEQSKEDALAAKAAAKAEKAANKTKRKSKATIADEDADGDTDMMDAPADPDDDAAEAPITEKKNKKKRKATEAVEDTPKTDSVKKPKTTINIKINSTPKATNGASTPKSVKDSTAKTTKPKVKKSALKAAASPEIIAAPVEPELTPEEKRAKKEKEILFLRHKLQKGLLAKDEAPKESEMQQMSEFVSKLEGYADLEVSIIRVTKINKVLKAILKLSSIPKEDQLHFKARSQGLLDKWNKLLNSEGTAAAGSPPIPTTTNGVAKSETEDVKAAPAATSNGTKESSVEEKAEEKIEKALAPAVEEAVTESKPEPADPVDSAV